MNASAPATGPNQHGSARALATAFLQRGPLILLVDPNAAGCSNLPEMAKDRVLVLQFAGEDDSARLAQPGSTFAVPYAADSDRLEIARIPWQAVFALSGQSAEGERETKARTEAVPECLGLDKRQGLRWVLQKLGLGDVPHDAQEWRFALSPQLLQADADRAEFEPELANAIQRILARAPGFALLMVDPTVPGVQLPPGLDAQVVLQLTVALVPPFRDVKLDKRGIRWREEHEAEILSFSLPWAAIGAVKHPVDGKGWFWPLQLPVPIRANLMQQRELWPHLQRLVGLPLTPDDPLPTDPPPLAYLAEPAEGSKSRAITRCLQCGGAVLLVDTRKGGGQLPDDLRKQALLAVPLALPGLPAEVQVDDQEISAVMPDLAGKPVRVVVPLDAVFVVATGLGGMRVFCWPEDYPHELVVGLCALREMARNDGKILHQMQGLHIGPNPPPPPHEGTQVGLGRNAEGRYVMQLKQPCGPRQADGSRLQMQVEFALQMPKLH